MYLYKALNHVIPMINSYESFELTEDKFQTAFLLRRNKIQTADYKLCHRDDTHHLKTIIKKNGIKWFTNQLMVGGVELVLQK